MEKKSIKVWDTQIVEPIVNLTYDNISLCPINKYKLKYSSNDNNVLSVNKFRIVYGNFFANVIIICNKWRWFSICKFINKYKMWT